ncbi:Dolichyl-diphosphooligosaccharide-protein glycosyltransferase subunit dad1 [Bulinus truncatus]|nr:Dolichyl-diphosphooligosaccharide-protein glycosyltransferase subunit dad1 [Bulinus truncatus]
MQSTPKKLKIIDAYLVYVLLTGIVQFAYCCLVGTFPFNSFLSGFISTVGSFILAGNDKFHWINQVSSRIFSSMCSWSDKCKMNILFCCS